MFILVFLSIRRVFFFFFMFCFGLVFEFFLGYFGVVIYICFFKCVFICVEEGIIGIFCLLNFFIIFRDFLED